MSESRNDPAGHPAALKAGLAARYRVEHELGRGGMATVYHAWDLQHDRPVALKVLHGEIARTIGTERFLREIRLSARLQHPHILTVLDSGETDGQFWFTMPFIDGESLAARLKRDRQLPLEDALRIAREVADALQHAHDLGILHRDIKPGNILLSGNHALVSDFGIARAMTETDPRGGRLTETGLAIGTPEYMSPEQGAGERDLDARSDLYALGCVVYEMLAGEPPFTGASGRAILAKRLTEPVPHLGTLRQVPPAVESAVTRALARSPADRFDSVGAFSRELSAADVARAPSRLGRRTWAVALAALAVLAALILTVRQLRQSTAGATGDLSSAAVLPFLDLSPGHDQAYFSDGLTDELTNALGRIPTLRMAARTSAFQFRGPGVDVHDVGQKLGVGAVLEGSVRKMGDRLHVSAQLVGTRDGFELWSETYDRQLADVFAVQEEIARAIASALRIRLTGKADSALVERPTSSLEAYDFYLQGQFALNQRTNASITEAIRLFEQAVARDSGLAKAWAGMADAYVLQPQYSGTAPAVAWPRGKAAAQRAIALKPGLAEAHTSLAYGTMLYEWDWAAAEREFQSAIAADPSYPTARHWYGDFLAGRNRLEEALLQMRRAHELDPLSRITNAELAWLYTSLHRTTEADSIVSQLLRLDPNFPQATLILGMLRLVQHRAPEAVVAFKQSLALGGFIAHSAACLVAAYAAAGDRPAAVALLDTLKIRSRHEYVPPSALALAYANLGDLDQAFTWLDRGLAERDALLPENFFEPMFDPLKGDPRYARVVARLTAVSPQP